MDQEGDEGKRIINGHANGSANGGGKKEKVVDSDIFAGVVNHVS
jgi:hypothetical protein